MTETCSRFDVCLPVIESTLPNPQMFHFYVQYLAEIEDHLNVTIQQVGPDIKVPLNQFDGKVTYGQKRIDSGMEKK